MEGWLKGLGILEFQSGSPGYARPKDFSLLPYLDHLILLQRAAEGQVLPYARRRSRHTPVAPGVESGLHGVDGRLVISPLPIITIGSKSYIYCSNTA
jgi:hypothetical protein